VTVLESQITDLETEASRLIRSLDTQKELLETERASSSKRIEALEKDQVEKDREIESCRDRLKQFGDYDELRRELEIMKVNDNVSLTYRAELTLSIPQYVEFAGMNLDEVVGEAGDSVADLVRMPDPNADKLNQQRGKPLENLLMAKNRKLQDELTALRVSLHLSLVIQSDRADAVSSLRSPTTS